MPNPERATLGPGFDFSKQSLQNSGFCGNLSRPRLGKSEIRNTVLKDYARHSNIPTSQVGQIFEVLANKEHALCQLPALFGFLSGSARGLQVTVLTSTNRMLKAYKD